MEKFEKCLIDLLNVVCKNYPSQEPTIKKHYKIVDNISIEEVEKHLESFLKNCNGKGDDISSKNEIIFSKESVLLDNVDFHSIWNDESLSDAQRENIWKYLHSLYLHAYECHSDKDVKTILRELKKLSKAKNSELTEEERTFLNIIECLTIEKKVENTKSDDEEDDDETTEGPDINNIKDTFESMQNELFHGQIGTLAKEIASELDINKLNLENPVDLLKSVMSGNLDTENDKSGLSTLVKNISDKVQNKLSTGELDENKLYEEAKVVMNKFSKMAGGTGNKNVNKMASMFTNIMKKAEGNDDMNEADIMQMARSMMPKNLSGLMTRKDRLKKKLEDKKRNRQ
jgi:hypothetical protein